MVLEQLADYDTSNYVTISDLFHTGITNIQFFPLGLSIILVTTLGITGNLISSYILSRKRLKSSSYSVLTQGLTLVDIVYLLTKLLRFGLLSLFSYFNIFPSYGSYFLPNYGPYLRALTFTAHTATTYMTLMIAFDRYIVISRPSTARSFCTTRQARITIILTIAFAILYNMPRWWEYHSESSIETDEEGQTVPKHKMKISDLRINPSYKLFYVFYSYFLIMFFLPLTSLSILNYLVWRGIRNIRNSGLVLNYTQIRDTSFSTMLLGVVFVFLVCNLDYIVLDLLDYYGVFYSPLWHDVGNFLLTVNSAVNFLIYCLCGHKFRYELRQVFQNFWMFFSNPPPPSSQIIMSSAGPKRDAT